MKKFLFILFALMLCLSTAIFTISCEYVGEQTSNESENISNGESISEDSPYKVNYYLQNLENDGYTLKESVELTGTTGTKATAEIKDYEHFTYSPLISKISGNIDGDGSLTLTVYYTIKTYSLSVNNPFAGSITNAGDHKYGTEEFTATATPISLAHGFLGWYNEETLLSTDNT